MTTRRLMVRALGAGLSLMAIGGITACSDGDGDGGNAGDGGSVEAYCEVATEVYEIAERAADGSIQPGDPQRFLELMGQAAAVTPEQIRADSTKAFAGDQYAKDNVDQFTEKECGIDTRSLAPITTPS